jgi:hypothetical protein
MIAADGCELLPLLQIVLAEIKLDFILRPKACRVARRSFHL